MYLQYLIKTLIDLVFVGDHKSVGEKIKIESCISEDHVTGEI